MNNDSAKKWYQRGISMCAKRKFSDVPDHYAAVSPSKQQGCNTRLHSRSFEMFMYVKRLSPWRLR